MRFVVAFERRFSMAHRLTSGASGKCMVPHGHNEFVRVQLAASGTSASNKKPVLDGDRNMLFPFEAVKKRWHGFIDDAVDHAFQLSEADPLVGYFKEHEPHHVKRLLITPGDPTTEMVAACLIAKMQSFLDDEGLALKCVRLELQETPTNAVVIEGNDRSSEPLLLASKNQWWNRADYSINDLEGS